MVLGFFFLIKLNHTVHIGTSILIYCVVRIFKDVFKVFWEEFKRHKIHLKTYSNGGILEQVQRSSLADSTSKSKLYRDDLKQENPAS